MDILSYLPQTDVWQTLQKTDKHIYLYGTGNGADKIVAVCDRYGITVEGFFASDDFVRGQSFHGQRVLKFSEVLDKHGAENVAVLVSFASALPEVMANVVLSHFGLDKYFDIICGASLDRSRSSKASVVKYALERAGVTDKSRCIMIGDRKFDVEGARENGLSTLGITHGYGDRAELEGAGAIQIFDDTYSLCEFLLN